MTKKKNSKPAAPAAKAESRNPNVEASEAESLMAEFGVEESSPEAGDESGERKAESGEEPLGEMSNDECLMSNAEPAAGERDGAGDSATPLVEASPIEYVTIRVPLASLDAVGQKFRPSQVNVRLNGREHKDVFKRLFLGLQAQEEKVTRGRGQSVVQVRDASHALQWLLEQLAVAPPAE